uniref:Uncharacterized protein n=1 Tax=viral metagenome TaxID=1070528 RepID=A0A6M3IH16_9ZZZZ
MDIDIQIFKKQLSLHEMETVMKGFPEYAVDCPVSHVFSGGVYIRQILIPKGTLIMGKRHRHETCNILMKGTMSVFVGENEPLNVISGPLIFTSPPLSKKLAYTHEDCVFINIHPTNETDVDKIEQEFIIPEEEYLTVQNSIQKTIDQGERKCLG